MNQLFKKFLILTFLLSVLSITSVYAEGTKSVWPVFTGLTVSDQSGGILVNFISDPPNGGYPAYTYTSDSLARMYVNVKDFNSESIQFGFNVRRLWFSDCNAVPTINGDYTNAVSGGRRVFWRLKDPDGNIVATSGIGGIPYWNGGVTPSTTAGFIGSHPEAINGPDNLNGVGTTGYTPIVHNPTKNGDYYFEFNFNDQTTMFDNTNCSWATVEFQYFDISIASGTSTIPGRLWSRQWSLSTVNRAPNAGLTALAENTSEFFVYTTDSIISRIGLVDIVPGTWNVIANENGVGTSGIFADDAKSAVSPPTALNRLNQIFLSVPDTSIYPARPLTRSVSPIYVQRCASDDQCIIIELNRPSDANLYLEVNGIPGYQPATSDRLINAPALSKGINCIPWDGTDGLGTPVPEGDTIFIQVLFQSNVTQVPLQDIESNPNGLQISLVLPTSGSTSVFWDDTDVGGGSNLTGCVALPPAGCHSWTGNFTSGIGNGNVINSYWFSTLDTLIPIPIVDSTFSIDIVTETIDFSCSTLPNVDPGAINVVNFNGNPNTNFRWSTSGSGTFSPNDSSLFADYIPSAEDFEFGGTIQLFLKARVGCPEEIDTLEIFLGKRPGGVNDGLIAWYKANEGPLDGIGNPSSNGQPVPTWRNKAFLGNDASAVVSGPTFIENVFNNHPALVFSGDDNERLNLGLDLTEIITGNGTYEPINSTGIDNGSNASGNPNGNFAQVYDPGDLLVIDLGQILPAGATYTLTWRRKNSYINIATADMVVEESLNAGAGYSTNPVTPQTTSTTNFITTNLVTQNPTRYIRLSELTGTNDDFDFDAVTYSFVIDKSETIFLVASKADNSSNTYFSDENNVNRRTLFGDGTNNPILRFDGVTPVVNSPTTKANNEAFISTQQVNLSGNERFWVDGNSAYNSEFGAVGTTNSLVLGNNADNTAELNGAIAEFIIYNEVLTQAEVERIESYLAIKYGITLNHNYFDSQGNLLFIADGAGAEVFDHDIAGIGFDNCRMTLNQVSSISQNSDAVVQMSNPASFDELDYLIWANDNGSLSTINTLDVNPNLFTERISRVWKSTATNDPGSVTVSIYLGSIPGAGSDPFSYGLIKSNDPNMANGVLGPYVKYISNDTLYFEGVNFSGTEYFSLAFDVLDIDHDFVDDFTDLDDDNDGILDIDEGICEFTGSVDAYWPMDNSTDDVSGNNRNAGAGTNAPPFSTDAIQGTHSANFNGTNHVIRYSVDGEFMEAVYNTVSFSAWIKPSSLTGTRIIYEEGGFTNGLALWLNGNTLTYSTRNGGAGSQTNIAYSQTLSLDGIWHHVACTFDNGVMKLYLDGVPETTTAAYTTIPSHTSNGGLGGDISDNASGALGNYAGLLDAARYSFTEVWSDARIALEAEPLCDSDGDGIPNKFDLDSDNDGIPDIIEAGGIDIDGDGRVDVFADTDGDGWADTFDPDNGGTPLADEDQNGDGLRNRIDIDSDNDGIIDNIEAQASTASPIVPTGIDSDNDGVDNAFDIDNGGNFLVPVNTDALDLPDYLDTDSDNDGYSDFIEGYDMNNDKVADISISGLDTDSDGLDDVFDNVNGINPSTNVTNGGQTSDDFPNLDQPLTAERDWREKLDTDGDGVADFFDVDNDNDGILDVDESDCNNPQVLFTGMVDAFWAMDNSTNDISGNNRNAGAGTVAPTFTTDAVQGTHAAVFNGTNQKVRYSVDNGFMESDYTQVSFSAWIKPNSLTGTRIIYEEGATTNGLTLWLSGNTLRYSARSGSNQINLVHTETLALDNAWHHVACTFNEGLMSLYFDGEVVTLIAPYTSIPPHSSDGGVGGEFGGTAANVTGNYSGLLDAARYSFTEAWPSSRIVYESQRLCDSDGDGVFDRFDLDADNDGVPDIIEAGGVDGDGDGRVGAFVDTDGDGWADTFDPDNGGTPLTDDDIDGDGYPNRLDLDSDNDGLIDNVEAQTTAAFQALSGLDTDGDGWDDSYDSDNGGTAITLSDADSDGTPDYLDLDSDGDGLPDWIEGFDENGSVDALDDFLIRSDNFELAAGNPLFYVNTDDADADGIPDWLEDDNTNGFPNFLDPTHPLYQDSDGDGLIDLYDTDNFGVLSNLPDLDGDGEYDFRDTDNQISLPITLIYFNAIKQGDQVLLTWATSSEINNDYFTIERSSDARNYKTILEHPGAGNSQMEIQYQRFDKTPLQGNNYYRLRQTDFDGKTDITSPKVVYFSSAIEAMEMYPNPNGADELYLMFTNLAVGNYRFKIQDIQGKLHRDELFNIGKEERKVVKVMRGMSNLAKGTYIISITGENFVRHLKYIQQ